MRGGEVRPGFHYFQNGFSQNQLMVPPPPHTERQYNDRHQPDRETESARDRKRERQRARDREQENK